MSSLTYLYHKFASHRLITHLGMHRRSSPGEHRVCTVPEPEPTTSEDLLRLQIGCHNAPQLLIVPEYKNGSLIWDIFLIRSNLVYKYTSIEEAVKETGTTPCEGFIMDNQVTISASETSYGLFEFRAGQSPEPDPTQERPKEGMD